jgi:hypothetical protein
VVSAALGAGSIAENKMNWFSNAVKALVRGLGDLSPNCKTATRLQSAARDRKLTLCEKSGLRVHLFLCKWCRSYGSQINFLCSAAREDAHDHQSHPQALSPEARERIKRLLQSNKD